MLGISLRDPSLLLVITVVGVTVLLLALKSMNCGRKDITLLDPEAKYPLVLIEKEHINHNTRRFRFGLPSPDHTLGLPIGNYVHLLARINDELVVRAYTPVSHDDDRGFVDFIIKIYFKNVHPKYPEGGKMTQYLENMNIGDTILCRGPTGRLFYHGPGKLAIKAYPSSKSEEKLVCHLGMIAGGTGITPMLQLIRHVIKNPNDRTMMSLLFANQSPPPLRPRHCCAVALQRLVLAEGAELSLRLDQLHLLGLVSKCGGQKTEEDILLRKELEEIARTHVDQFNLWYTLDRPPTGWKYSSGFVTADMIKEHLPPPGKTTLILVCGPPPLIQTAAHPNLELLGYTKDMIFTY